MPRLLPRLVSYIQKQNTTRLIPFDVKTSKPRRKGLKKPVPPLPSFDAEQYTQSILLSPLNPITSSRDYVRHKTLPPYLQRTPKYRSTAFESPRQMTAEERRWWSNPYLRMIATPLRRCLLTEVYLPSDLLIRLSPVKLPETDSRLVRKDLHARTTLVPDGLEHSKFRVRRAGKAVYVLCWKQALLEFRERAKWRRFARQGMLHSLLPHQVSHLLRLRVLQELELLAEKLETDHKVENAKIPILRRLTRSELQEIRDTGVVPFPGALAVLIVPPVNRNPVTKEQYKPSMHSSPPADLDLNLESTFPISTMLTDDKVSTLRVPLYHGVAMFPSKSQRVALHSLLGRILAAERKTKFRKFQVSATPNMADSTTISPSDSSARWSQKASHAFLLSSDEDTISRADSAAVAIALWRIRLFEGADWIEEPSGWLWRQKLRSSNDFEPV